MADIEPRLAENLPEGPWLIVAPRFQDVVAGMGGSLLLALRRGLRLTVVLLAGSEAETAIASELMCNGTGAISEQPAAGACNVLGLSLIERRDGLTAASPASVRRLAQVMRSIQFHSVFYSSPWNLEPASRLAAAIVRESLSCGGCAADAYAFETTRQSAVSTLIDISQTFTHKRQLLELLQARALVHGCIEVPLRLSQERTRKLPTVSIAAEGFSTQGVALDQGDVGVSRESAPRPLSSPTGADGLPLVSVIIRTMDRAELLSDALASVAHQTYPNIEVVVVNDGGCDISAAAAPFDASFARLSLIQLSENRGRAHVANLGLKDALGEYLCFLDDDDWFIPGHIAALVDALRGAAEYKAAYAGVRCVRRVNGEWEELHVFNEPFDAIRLAYENYLPMHAILFHRSLVDAGCLLEERFDVYEDWDFWIQLSQQTAFAHVDRVSAYYRIGEDSGFGIAGNPATISQGLDKLLDKWRRLWTPSTLRGMLDRARKASRVDSLETKLDANGRDLERLRSELAEANHRIRDLEPQVAQLRQDKQALEEALAERDARVEEQRRTMLLNQEQFDAAKVSADESIRDLEHRLQQMRAERQTLEAVLAKQEARLDAQQEAILEQQEQTSAVKLTMSERIRELAGAADEARARAEALEHRIATIQEQAADQQQLLAHAQHEVISLQAELTVVRASLAQVYASTSWRLTGPLRAIRMGLMRPRTGNQESAERISLKRQLLASWSRSRSIMDQHGLSVLAARVLAKLTGRPLISIVVFAEADRDLQKTVQSAIDHNGGYRYEVLIVETGLGTVPPELRRLGHCRVIRAGLLDEAWAEVLQRARADVVALLRAGAQVDPGCLHQLLQTCLQRPDVGLVGARLLKLDGSICAAGGLLSRDGRVAIYGQGDNGEKPEYNYVRDTAFLPPGALAMTKGALEAAICRLGDDHSWPHWWMINLSMATRDAGYRVLYQPAAVAYSEHGTMQSSDLMAGETFKTQWQASDQSESVPEQFEPFLSRDYGVRGRILVIDYVMITPDQDSGSLRMANMLTVLQDLGYKVTFVAFNLDLRPPYGAQLQQQGIEILHAPFTYSIPKYLEEHGHYFDVIVVSRPDVADAFIDVARHAAPEARIWFDTVDLHFLRELRMAEHEGCEQRAKDAQTRMEQELSLVDRADVTLVVSPVEKALLMKHRPGARVEIVSNIHEVHGLAAPFEKRNGLLFIGGFNHPPNPDAMLYFVGEILPLIRSRLGDVSLTIVGSEPPPEVLALGQEPGITVTGYVPDVSDHFAQARLSIAPLRYGAGVKGKINQSMAYGVPVVATSIAVEGMYLENGRDVLVADEPVAFADAVAQVYKDRALWKQLSRNGLENLEQHFSRRAARSVLERLVSETELS
jgi:glycosyltransferase involved in cell wall biosynthesis/LmbE family N-acetylglucosaminyl deacetylase